MLAARRAQELTKRVAHAAIAGLPPPTARHLWRTGALQERGGPSYWAENNGDDAVLKTPEWQCSLSPNAP
eukprot:1364736-Lingulodinium_polyedra.AAC.1